MPPPEVQSVLLNIGISVSSFIFIYAIYEFTRHKFPRHYNVRRTSASDPTANTFGGKHIFSLPDPPRNLFRFTLFIWKYPEEKLIQNYGLDIALYLHFIYSQLKFYFFASVFTLVFLIPTYFTGAVKNSSDPSLHPDKMELFSIINVVDGSFRLWFTLTAHLVLGFVLLSCLRSEAIKYSQIRRKYRADHTNPSNFTVLAMDIPKADCDPIAIYQTFDSMFPGHVEAVLPINDARLLQKAKLDCIKALTTRERAQWKASSTTKHAPLPLPGGPDPRRPPSYSQLYIGEAKVAKCMAYEDLLKSQLISKAENLHHSAPVMNGVFIFFRSPVIATYVATGPFSANPSTWKLSRAGEPKAIEWTRLHIKAHTQTLRRLGSFFIIFTFIVAWFIPANFLVALADFDEASRRYNLPSLSVFTQNNLRLARILERVLPPLMLFLLLICIPFLVTQAIRIERHHNRAHADSKKLFYLFLFFIMSNFFYVVTIGSLYKDIKKVLNNPAQIISLLAKYIPPHATFLIKYILVNAALSHSLSMVNVTRWVSRPGKMKRAVTPREKQIADRTFTKFDFPKYYALCTMVSVIGQVYMSVAPFICIPACLYFFSAYLCGKQALMYGYRPQYEGGGVLFRKAWHNLTVGVGMHQVFMVGTFSLKQAPVQALISLFWFGLSMWFIDHVRRRHFFRAKHGTVMEQIAGFPEEKLTGEFYEKIIKMYKHPGLTPLEELEAYWQPANFDDSEDGSDNESSEVQSESIVDASENIQVDSDSGQHGRKDS